ncbi:hypothetical protein Q648_00372 [Bartonella quintana JK 12]|nr:hypothetical protein Q647_00783 [Bartonella quintana JK 7]ETS18680.1 hypothetical protein Q648_00372 [Bartonella quintana JK 12]KEC68381.1 hypothetical protein O7Q_00836 [Bartonella quintana JK 39]
MDACRKVFKMKPADSFSRQIVGIFVGTLDNLSQQNLAELKKLLGKVGKKERICRDTFENPIFSLLLTHLFNKINKINTLSDIKKSMVRPRGIEPLFPP